MAAAKSERAKQKLEDRLLTCSVCLDRYTDPRILPCHHCFCKDCIVPLPRVLSNGRHHINCPLCKMSIPVPDNEMFPPAFHINSLMEITEQYMAITPVPKEPILPSGNRQSMAPAGPLNTSRPLPPPPAHDGNRHSIAFAGRPLPPLPVHNGNRHSIALARRPLPPPPAHNGNRHSIASAGPLNTSRPLPRAPSPPPPSPPPPRTGKRHSIASAGPLNTSCPLPPPPPPRTQLSQAGRPLRPSSSNSDRPHLGPPVPPKGNKEINSSLLSNEKSCGGPPPLPPKPSSWRP